MTQQTAGAVASHQFPLALKFEKTRAAQVDPVYTVACITSEKTQIWETPIFYNGLSHFCLRNHLYHSVQKIDLPLALERDLLRVFALQTSL